MKMIAFLMKVSLTSLFGKILMEIQFKPKQKENRQFRENLPDLSDMTDVVFSQTR